MSQSSQQRVALVTGASSGFGWLIAEQLSRDGLRTFGTSRAGRPGPSGVEMVELDVRSDDSVQACLQSVRSRAGRIDVLVNNAGVLDVGTAEERTVADVRALFETNFFGVVRLTNGVLPEMRERGAGQIVNIGSLAGLIAPPGEAIYAASKFALEGYCEALSYEIAPFGVSVSLIEPGFFKTSLGESVPEVVGNIEAYDRFREAIRSSIAQRINTGGDPQMVAQLVSRVVQSKRPKLRYRVGSDAIWLPRMRRLMPERLFMWGLRREFGI